MARKSSISMVLGKNLGAFQKDQAKERTLLGTPGAGSVCTKLIRKEIVPGFGPIY